MAEIQPNSIYDVSTRGISNTNLANFKGKSRQVVINIDDGMRPIVMDGITLGGKFKCASIDDISNQFKAKATNIITDSVNDTEEYWETIDAGVYWFSKEGCITDQPSSYGHLIHFTADGYIFQLWKCAPNGDLFHRGGNFNGWNGSWQKVSNIFSINNSYPDINGNVTVDIGVKKVNGYSPDASGNVDPKCLSLDGGNLTGNIQCYKNNVYVGNISTNANDTDINFDINTINGARLILRHGESPTSPKTFSIIANGENKTGILEGNTENLSWNGKHIVRSINNTEADASGNVALQCLSLSGGTLSGEIIHSNKLALRRNVDNDSLQINGGTLWENGAGLNLYGKDAVNGNEGAFLLHAKDNTSEVALLGKPDGSLTWNQNNIVRSVNGIGADSTGDIHLNYLLATGDRGSLAGYETLSSSTTDVVISDGSDDDTVVNGAVNITVSNGLGGKVWTKTVGIINQSTTISLGSRWYWVNGNVPIVGSNSVLVLKWYGSFGIANLILTA